MFKCVRFKHTCGRLKLLVFLNLKLISFIKTLCLCAEFNGKEKENDSQITISCFYSQFIQHLNLIGPGLIFLCKYTETKLS